MEKRVYRQSRREIIEGLKSPPTSSKDLPPDQLPFDLTMELGSVIRAEEISPGVYSLLAHKGDENTEYYVVTKDAPAISDKARSYGQVFAGKPDLCVYDQSWPEDGRYIIDFEIFRYHRKHCLPVDKYGDSIHTIALYGMEGCSDYFGEYPVPGNTPRGYTVRHKKIINGVYWLETDRCEEMLSICYPIWKADLTFQEQDLGEQLEYDQIRGIDTTLGNLFFSKEYSCIPLLELSLIYSEIKTNGVINMPALFNAAFKSYPEYTTAYNKEQAGYRQNALIEETPDAGTEFIEF
ncbi:hypothetical protein D1159_16870 [Pseudoflavonifractor sp. 524-17]|uniref:hypothetical protein n=1 Tax=Pseudoflavonifractor sp. 524-17 TaxID=2304577 RepID=UPI001379A92E|nr:hypothetical protein [Pseudoflavonifractor sp. 524-17]NCE66202.1 hypothetical protein [Pseudoflavonifractor sp. 524-17]